MSRLRPWFGVQVLRQAVLPPLPQRLQHRQPVTRHPMRPRLAPRRPPALPHLLLRRSALRLPALLLTRLPRHLGLPLLLPAPLFLLPARPRLLLRLVPL